MPPQPLRVSLPYCARPPLRPPTHAHAQHPEAAHRLLAGITRILVELLVAQYEAGADVLQVFETNADALPPARFVEFAQPYLLRLAAEVRARTAPAAAGGPALSIFAKGATHALAALAAPDSNYDVISLDWNTDPAAAVATVRAAATASGAAPKVLQGNLDPGELFGSPQTIAAATADMLTRFDGHPLIANLGHGMLPSHTPEALGAFFDAVKAHAGK